MRWIEELMIWIDENIVFLEKIGYVGVDDFLFWDFYFFNLFRLIFSVLGNFDILFLRFEVSV